jgi:RNA polymerase sigma-70 factor (ECF subfamily)
MDEREWLVERFEEHRAHLRAVAYRMLGSMAEADDAVQEAWLRVSRAYTSSVENLGGWLTTIVARVSLNMLRSRGSRREEPLDVHVPDPMVSREGAVDPEQEALLADSVGLALLVVLDTLAPPERLASSPAGPGAGCRERRPPPTPTSPASARWSMPSSLPPGEGTSTRWWQCSTPTSSCEPTPEPAKRARWWCTARRKWRPEP